MVSSRRLLVLAALALVAASPDPDVVLSGDGSASTNDARQALAERGYPWYDAQEDRVVPVLPEPDWDAGWIKRTGDWFSSFFKPIGDWFASFNGWRLPGIGVGAGDLIAIGLATLLVTVLLVVLLEMLRRYRPIDQEKVGSSTIGKGEARRIEGLPIADSIDLTDPWAQAKRLRERGDFAGAIVYLFAHQLLTLSRIGQLRLIPGKTGRQLTRSVPDRTLRQRVEPTLRLFEAVYYGQRAPTAEAFATVWTQAEAFERDVRARIEGAVA
ncbi:MAG: DUF4129 domain-containing protein [Isosphaeraceae bacterium]